VIAGAFASPDCPIDACIPQPRGDGGAEQEMIEAKAGISLPSVPQVVPEGVDALIGMQ
jgi:hypothetical protein